MYLTGTPRHSKQLRDMVTDHMLRNIDQFLVLTQMVEQDFQKYIKR